MTTIAELETILDNAGWEPDYRESTHSGKELPHPVFEIDVDGRIISIELSDVDNGDVINFARIWEYDEDEGSVGSIWNIEDTSSTENIISDIELFIESE